MKIVVLLGLPGAGKGTQARLLAEKLDASVIGVGDLLRKEIKLRSEIGKIIRPIVESGGMPDLPLVMKVLNQHLEQQAAERIILDGFPRNIVQAEVLEKLLKEKNWQLEAVFLLSVPKEMLVNRMLGRYICAKCGMLYSKGFHDSKAGKACEKCGSEDFIRRPDDKEMVIKNRLKNSQGPSEDLIKFYEKKGLITPIEGMQPIAKVNAKMLKVLEN